jgi:hypothetical protein
MRIESQDKKHKLFMKSLRRVQKHRLREKNDYVAGGL